MNLLLYEDIVWANSSLIFTIHKTFYPQKFFPWKYLHIFTSSSSSSGIPINLVKTFFRFDLMRFADTFQNQQTQAAAQSCFEVRYSNKRSTTVAKFVRQWAATWFFSASSKSASILLESSYLTVAVQKRSTKTNKCQWPRGTLSCHAYYKCNFFNRIAFSLHFPRRVAKGFRPWPSIEVVWPNFKASPLVLGDNKSFTPADSISSQNYFQIMNSPKRLHAL